MGIVFVAFIGISGVISLQVRSFLEDADVMKERLSPVAQKVELFVLAHTPLERSKLEAYKETYGLNDEKSIEVEKHRTLLRRKHF